MAKARQEHRTCKGCGQSKALSCFRRSYDLCDVCEGHQTATGAISTIGSQAVATALRENVSRDAPDVPAIMDAAIRKLGGHTAIGDMIGDQILDLTGMLKPDGGKRTEEEMLQAGGRPGVQRLTQKWFDLLLRTAQGNDAYKRDTRRLESMDEETLQAEFRDMSMRLIREDAEYRRWVFEQIKADPELNREYSDGAIPALADMELPE